MANGVECLSVEAEEQNEITQPRVTKAQKRRVSCRFHLRAVMLTQTIDYH